MLRHLRVTNFALLSDVTIEFSAGFNVLTGETGAGKSLVVEAVNLLRGGRASADIPRAGADEATVEAIFDVPADLRPEVRRLLDEGGLAPCDASSFEVMVRRVVQRGGKSRTYVNGALTTARRLAELGSYLVDLSSQHQHQGLVDSERHRQILDAFAQNHELVAEMVSRHQRLREAEQAVAALAGDEQAIAERIDYLRFQLHEIDQADLASGEDEELQRERGRLGAVDRLAHGTRAAEELAYSGQDAAVDRLAQAARELGRVVAVDERLAAPLHQLEEARALAEDAAATLRHYAESLDSDPARLAEIEDRLALIARLNRKHGDSVADILARADALRGELTTLEGRDQHLADREATRARAEKEAQETAARLRAARKRAAKRLCGDAEKILADLAMPAAKLSVAMESRSLGPSGGDRVEFFIATNPGEQRKPLAKIASGGELSRVMLALKLVLRRADTVASYVFDEVDAGIGGATAEAVARLMRSLADEKQILCVTHLPQIAAFADRHFQVSKFERDGRTETAVTALSDSQRREETARLLGGRSTPRARAHAQELLRAARR